MGAEIALRVGGLAGPRIGVDLLENGRVVGEIEQPLERIQRAGAADEAVVVLLPAKFGAELERVIAGDFAQAVAQLELVLREFGRRGLALRRAEADAVGQASPSTSSRGIPKFTLAGIGDSVVAKSG